MATTTTARIRMRSVLAPNSGAGDADTTQRLRLLRTTKRGRNMITLRAGLGNELLQSVS
jgi:hypothetical protein